MSISGRYVSQSLSYIISHRTARLNERVHSLMRQHHPHLLSVFFQSSPGQEMDFKHSITEFTVKPSFYVEAFIISPHLEGLDQMAAQSLPIGSASGFGQPSSNFMVKSELQVISISVCGAQQSRAHNHAHSLRFTTDQVLK